MLIFVFLLFAGKGFSQTAVQSGDTLRIRQQQMEQQKEQQKEQEKLRQGEQQGRLRLLGKCPWPANGNKQNKAVKQVREAVLT